MNERTSALVQSLIKNRHSFFFPSLSQRFQPPRVAAVMMMIIHFLLIQNIKSSLLSLFNVTVDMLPASLSTYITTPEKTRLRFFLTIIDSLCIQSMEEKS